MATDTRSRIIRAATELFWEKGYNATSVADILSSAHIYSGSLYHFFPGKEDVLVGVLEAYRDGMMPELVEPSWDGVDDPIERIFALLNSYRQTLVETKLQIGCPIGCIALELHDPSPRVRTLIIEIFAIWRDAVKACLEQAADRIPPDADRQSLAEFIFSAMQGWAMQVRTHQDISFLDRGVAVLRDFFDRLDQTAHKELRAG